MEKAAPMENAAMEPVAMKDMAKQQAKKRKRVGSVATGPRARLLVFLGKKERTKYGLRKEDLTLNHYGKVVSKKVSDVSKQRFGKHACNAWCEAVSIARETLGMVGFVPVGGSSAEGQALYKKAKSILGA